MTGGPPSRARLVGLVALLAVTEGCLLIWVGAGDLRQRPYLFLGSYAVCFAAYIAAFLSGRQVLSGRRAFWWMFGAAVVFRLTLLPAQPTLSDDLYRYVWDGKMQSAGINPFAHAPDDPELVFLRDDHWERINHREIHTIYPPAMQLFFAAAYRVLPGLLGFKLLLVICDLGILGILWRLARRLEVQPWNVVIYAWNPLVLLEVAASGHNDVVALLLLLAALSLIMGARRLLSTGLFATAILAKVFPLLLLPTFLRRTPSTKLWPLPLIMLLGFWPYLGAGWRVTEGLSAYGQRWQYNDILFRWVLAFTEWLQPRAALEAAIVWVQRLFADTEALAFLHDVAHPQYLARGLVALVAVGVAVRVSFLEWHPTREVLVALAALLILSPTVHPWYLLWFAPLLVLHPSAGLLLWTLLAPLSYFLGAADPGGDPPGGWLLYAEYLPVLALLGLELRRGVRAGLPLPGRFPLAGDPS